MNSQQTKRDMIYAQIVQNLPSYDSTKIDEIVNIMAAPASNAYAIFFADSAYEVQQKGSIKRCAFKHKLQQLLQQSPHPILAITINFVGTVEVYKLNETATDFTRITVDPSQLQSSSTSVSSMSTLEVPSSSSETVASNSSTFDRLLAQYTKIHDTLYPPRH